MKKFDSTQLFKSCQTVYQRTAGQPIQPADQLNIETEVSLLSRFFGITEAEVFVLSYYICMSLNEDAIQLDEMVAHFGGDLAQFPLINQVICSLIKKGRLQEKSRSTKGRLDAFVSAVIHPRTIQGLLKGNKKSLKMQPFADFIDLVEEIKKQVDLKEYNTISGEAMQTEVDCMLQANKHFPEVKWLNQFNLLTTEVLILIMMIADTLENNDMSNLPEIIDKVTLSRKESYRIQNSLTLGGHILIMHDLIELYPNEFKQCEFGSITQKTFSAVIQDSVVLKKKGFTSRIANLLEHEKIEAESLFFGEGFSRQLEPLQNALQEQNYQHVRAQIKNSNKGLTFLFHGAPGTGKTALVKQLALQTQRHLLMVDVAVIRNMYVGESEKNIRRIFKEYEMAKRHFDLHPILLFNEADALIGKRINVNNSVDQMNNAMQNILLQYLEDFDGIFMATTNLPASLDEAFNRRFLYKIEFQNPDKAVRLQMLQHHYPSLPIPFLQELNECYALTGAQLVNINKKIMVEQLLRPEIQLDELLIRLCAEEKSSLGKNRSTPIGFLSKAS